LSGAGYVRRGMRVVYENPWLRFEAHDMVHPTGADGEHGVVVSPPGSAAVLIEGDTVLLTRQARFAVDAVVLEVIKGGKHDGESALACAIRESREEAGVVAAHWTSLGSCYEIPSIMKHPLALFLATGLSPSPLEPENVERIEIVRMPFDDALEACIDGRIGDAVTAVALLRAKRARELLR
jgi:8-oxo-dGTP pyrophosphatase MutT (NUDIX family)